MPARHLPVLALLIACVASVAHASQPPAGDRPETYLLRYHFREGDTVRWNVVHSCEVRTTINDTTQTAETTSTSVKVWRVRQVQPDGTATFEHVVQDVDMRNRLTGRDEVHYNSRRDIAPPAGFEDIAQAVGVPLAVLTLDCRGKVLKQAKSQIKATASTNGGITVCLPERPVAVGAQWSLPHPIDVPLPDGTVRRVESRQTLTLESVKTGVATIRVSSEILTPVNDPRLESQLLPFESSGWVRLDMDRGRILGQQIDVDKRVVGFRGGASSIRYLSRWTEELIPEKAGAARVPPAASQSIPAGREVAHHVR
jgi:hypothetical protein